MRDAFAVLFFVSVGMLFDPRSLLEAPGLIAATLAIIVLAKPLTALGIVLLLRYPPKVALAVAAALAQNLGLLPDAANSAIVAAAIVSISLNPLLYRMVDPLDSWATRRRGLW